MHAFEPKKLAIASGITASLLGAFMLGGVALGTVSANSHGTPAATATADNEGKNERPETPINPAQAKIAKAQAESTALGAYPGGSVVRSYLDNEHGILVWDVAVKDAQGAAHEVLVDATSGQVVASRADEAGKEANEAPIDPAQAKVGQAQAESTALGAYPGGSVVKSQLDSENGTLVWDIEVKDSTGATHDVKVNATNGQVVVEPQDGPEGGSED